MFRLHSAPTPCEVCRLDGKAANSGSTNFGYVSVTAVIFKRNCELQMLDQLDSNSTDATSNADNNFRRAIRSAVRVRVPILLETGSADVGQKAAVSLDSHTDFTRQNEPDLSHTDTDFTVDLRVLEIARKVE